MTYLYHLVPKNLRGNILYPLNTLKEKYPDIYEQQVVKYAGREHITRQRIPILDCLWNDVLHFSAVDPKEIKQALIEAGQSPDFSMRCYRIDPGSIDPKNTIVYLFAHTNDKDEMGEENFASYNPDDVAKFSVMPQATKDYYKEMIVNGQRPLRYHRIPHVLYRGTLNIIELPIVFV